MQKFYFIPFASHSRYLLVMFFVASCCCGCNQILTPRDSEPRVLSKVETDSLNYEMMRAASGKNDSTILSYYELSSKLGRKSSETLSEAASRLMENQVLSPNREAGAKVLTYSRNMSEINGVFAREFYIAQRETITAIEKKYPLKWKELVRHNFGQRILEIHIGDKSK